MQVSVLLFDGDQGPWAAQCVDPPDLETPSSTLSGRTANFGPHLADAPATRRLTLDAVILTTFAEQALHENHLTMYLYIFQPKDRQATIDFEHRIEPRYADYYADLGVFYAGMFDVDGLHAPYLAEILAFDRPLEQAKDFVVNFEPAEDITAIEDECRTLQNRDLPRHLIWLTRPAPL